MIGIETNTNFLAKIVFFMKNPQRILITGANSGIGEAVALEYAKEGVFIAITGRNEERLAATKKELEAKGATVDARVLNVTDEAAMAVWVKSLAEDGPIDLVIANAGVGFGAGTKMSLHERAVKTFEVNVNGVFNTVHPAIDVMKQQGHGQIAIVSSVAGFLGLPGNPAYSASKNAVRAYAESLRGTYANRNIEVNVICPGYVISRMTAQNKHAMPFLMTSEKAAKIIVKGLAKNKARIAFPFPTFSLIRTLQALPYFIADKLLRVGPKK